MSYTEATVQLLSPQGTLVENDATAEYLPWISKLDDARLQDFYRQMVVIRRFDIEAGNLQRQGQLALWIPSLGQEGAQVGSGYAAKAQDHIFPAYREHVVGRIRGLDPMKHHRDAARSQPRRLGAGRDRQLPPLHPRDRVPVAARDRLRDGPPVRRRDRDRRPRDRRRRCSSTSATARRARATSARRFVFAASYQTPQVFFLQNNHWAISVPVERQSRTPLYLRSTGFGIPSVQIDGNDVLASYAITAQALDDARSGKGPRFIEALTYRMGAHTSSDDPSKYRDAEELTFWSERDPIVRFETFLRAKGEGDAFFAERRDRGRGRRRRHARAHATGWACRRHPRCSRTSTPTPHPGVDAQAAWFAAYEASYDSADGDRA